VNSYDSKKTGECSPSFNSVNRHSGKKQNHCSRKCRNKNNQSSSSRDYSASVWLQATTEPTPAATEPVETEATQPQPVASPINQPQQQTSTPVPAAGILAGLGAGLAAMALRRR
ncbi:MAG TPA: hypothetical protein O0W95_04415, partial [Methanocorpusculum sp.]|nr:hypothetical protein [Methanocorpusculum sp.]